MSRNSLNILLIWRRGYEDVWRGAEILGVPFSGGFEKSVRSRGRKQNLAIKLRARLHDPHQLALQRDRSTLVINATKINFVIT